MNQFKDKVIVITGAASGIGAALAGSLARHNAILVLIDVDADGLKRQLFATSQTAGQVVTHCCSVCDYPEMERIVREAIERFGRIDYFFNNAGKAIVGEACEFQIEDWYDVLDVNLRGVVNGIQVVYSRMVAQGHGHIVNIASIGGLVAFPFSAAYATSKFGVVGLSRALYYEGRRHNVMVSMACPSYVYTPILEKAKMVKFDRRKTIQMEERFFGVEKMTPEKCAAVILKGVAKKKRVILPSPYSHLLSFLQRYFPGLIDIMMQFGAWRMRTAAME